MYNELLAFTTVPIIQGFYIIVNPIINVFSGMLRVTLYAEKIETVFPALFFYPEDGGRR